MIFYQPIPGDQVRITIDATVVRCGEYDLTARYPTVTGMPEVTVARDAKAVTVLPGVAEPIGFEDYATAFEQIAQTYDRYEDGEISADEALDLIAEQVGDRPERLGDAS